MCRYSAASLACNVAGRRAEYTAKNASKLASGIEDTNSQVIREATELVDEWVLVRDGLAVAEEALTLIAQNLDAWEIFRQQLNAAPSASVAARRAVQARQTRPVNGVVIDAIRAVRRSSGVAS